MNVEGRELRHGEASRRTVVVGSFVGHALGAPADAWLRLPIANASITEIQSRPHGEWAVECVSDTGHLSG